MEVFQVSETTESYMCTVCKEIIDLSLVPLTADELKKHINPIKAEIKLKD